MIIGAILPKELLSNAEESEAIIEDEDGAESVHGTFTRNEDHSSIKIFIHPISRLKNSGVLHRGRRTPWHHKPILSGLTVMGL